MKRVLLASMVIVGVISLAAVGTYAGFVDTETSKDNTFQADPNDLFLKNPTGVGEQWGHSVLRTWHYEYKIPPSDPSLPPWYGRMEPGDTVSSHVKLNAFGTDEADHVDIHCVNVNSEPEMDTPPENEAEDTILGYDVTTDPGYGIFDKDTVMIITSMTYHTTTIISGSYINPAYFPPAADTDNDGRISLAEFQAYPLLNLTPVPNSEGEITFFMTVEFAADAGNEYQGDQTMMTLIFTLMQ